LERLLHWKAKMGCSCHKTDWVILLLAFHLVSDRKSSGFARIPEREIFTGCEWKHNTRTNKAGVSRTEGLGIAGLCHRVAFLLFRAADVLVISPASWFEARTTRIHVIARTFFHTASSGCVGRWSAALRRVAQVPGERVIPPSVGAPGPSPLGTWETSNLNRPFPRIVDVLVVGFLGGSRSIPIRSPRSPRLLLLRGGSSITASLGVWLRGPGHQDCGGWIEASLHASARCAD